MDFELKWTLKDEEMESKHQIYRPEETNQYVMAEQLTSDEDVNKLLGDIDFKDTSSIKVPDKLIDR